MTKTVAITGARGNIGAKLRQHFAALGWTLRLLDLEDGGDPDVLAADLSVWDERWVARLAGADAVILLAGSPSPATSWADMQRLNLDLTLNVYEAAARAGAKRLIFASSNWTMAGHRFAGGALPTDRAPYPINAYGASKLVGERLGRSYSERWGLSVICFRIGYCQRGENRPGPHMGWGAWGQEMWLSDRDLCQGFAKAVTAPETLRFAVLNLMSANPGMRWDIEATRAAIGYVPQDGHQAVVSEAQRLGAAAAADSLALIESAQAFLLNTRF
jgi:NAD(P)-dependent dehydrogenase (short-subunit alcohol dehydrogenase family)